MEHNPALVWKTNGRCYLVSSQGYAYTDISENIAQYSYLPLVEDKNNLSFLKEKPILSPTFIAFTQNIFKNISGETNIEPDTFYIYETTVDLTLVTKAGFLVKFDTMRSSKTELTDLKKVLIEKRPEIKEYVDLRVPGWAYYK